ncbi:hypothetical protein PC116_g4749 [Phytophthora cactorum]|uniref:Uncharacterized protein n=1 Tax=Phytophthora cactorum TaxID=29920 RepID=A0A8T1LJS1_9STRA|nr:hypothetical protein PC114_g7821 [Phytophthora cactorum]KAG2946231.1 hypothetical protein PC117_g7803 [Phytophthora cactorum]KAG3024174.1 hypothetical protein PC119_g8636 [Phytophthora cactorum]KAG3177796.1 hypothetical protein C6341_g8279 [Phytophthora cactorum]KAG3189814.1 hypothetical protein PC128_g11599 [Phytophthora cactorum]
MDHSRMITCRQRATGARLMISNGEIVLTGRINPVIDIIATQKNSATSSITSIPMDLALAESTPQNRT